MPTPTYTLKAIQRMYRRISPDHIFRAYKKAHITYGQVNDVSTALLAIIAIQETVVGP